MQEFFLAMLSLGNGIFGILHACEKCQQRHLSIDERRNDKIKRQKKQ